MVSYLVRRLLLMIPTLIGVTLLVFLLVGLSPGGIGAGLNDSGGMEASAGRAAQRAYLEDRYGLNDPILVQYVRWLARISPIKFGPRDQITPDGERFTMPRELSPPPLAGAWYPQPPRQSRPPLPPPTAEHDEAHRRVSAAFAHARAEYGAACAKLESSLRRYAQDAGWKDAFDRAGQLNMNVMRQRAPDPALGDVAAIREAGEQALLAYEAALDARAELAALFRARRFPEAGLPLIPGIVSLDAPDLGHSFSRGEPVAALIARHLPITLLLNILAFAIIYPIAISGGLLAAARHGTWIDRLLGSLFIALWSVPTMWAGVLAIGWLADKNSLGCFPVSGLHDVDAESFRFLPSVQDGRFHRGYLLDALWHLCLPVACLAYGGFALLARQTRAAVLESLRADYVRTARAKGASERDVLLRHAFRNSLLPLITMFAGVFPAMLSGSVVIERIFSIPGMGSLIIDAIFERDREVLLANALIIGIVNVVALLIADVLYAMADPRIRYA